MKVVTIGGAMIDSIAIIDDHVIQRMTGDEPGSTFLLLEQGRKHEAKQISHHTGGGAVNAAVCFSRLGFDVSTILRLGRDQRADQVLNRLEAEGVSTRWVERDARDATGSSLLIAAHDRDVSIFAYRGANTLLSADDLTPEMLGADLAYVSPLSNQAADGFGRIVEVAKSAGAKVAVNPGVRHLNRLGAEFVAALQHVDLVSVNRVEAAALAPQLSMQGVADGPPLTAPSGLKTPRLARLGLAAGGYDLSLTRYFRGLAQRGVGCALITDGAQGAYAFDGERIHFRAAEPAEVVGTVGAGDAFASTFAGWWAQTGDAAQALDAAAVNAASVVGHVDTQTGLLARDALDDRLADLRTSEAPRMAWSV